MRSLAVFAARDDLQTLLAFGDHLIDDAIFSGLLRLQDVVAIGIAHDLVDRLPGVIGQNLVQP